MKFRQRASPEEISGFLDQGASVTGELQFSGTLRIDGTFHGSIATDDILVIGPHAVVHADITAGEIEIHGQTAGRIEGRRRVEIFPTGRVQGDIHSPGLVIQSGGSFDGRSFMSPDTDSSLPSVHETTTARGIAPQVEAVIDSVHETIRMRRDDM